MFENLVECLTNLGEEIKEAYKDRLETEGINASGKLSNSVKAQVSVNGSVYEIVLQLEDYWKYIEKGRPSTQNNGNGELRRAILEWIRVKPIIPQPYNGKLPTEEQLAYLISRKIHRYGYEGKQPLHHTLEDMKDRIYEEIEQALAKDISIDVYNILRTITAK